MTQKQVAAVEEWVDRNVKPNTETPDDGSRARDAIRLPDNVIMDGIKAYDHADQDDIMWLFGWATEIGLSRSALCEKLAVDWSTVYRVATGTYNASIDGFMKAVRDLRKHAADASPKSSFIQTSVTRKIWDLLDYAIAGDFDGGKIVMISGPTRRGKTKAVREWCNRNNHGRSVYVDCPDGDGVRALMHEIAVKARIDSGRRTTDLRDRIIKSFNRRRMLVIDEVARLVRPGRKNRGVAELEFLRRLYDVKNCAIALVCTPVFPREMERGYLAEFLEQLLGRIATPLYIPDTVFVTECREIIRGFNPQPSDGLVQFAHKIANEPGKLGVLFELLHQAATLARKKKEPVEQRHLAAAYERRRNRFTWQEE